MEFIHVARMCLSVKKLDEANTKFILQIVSFCVTLRDNAP